MTHFAIPTQSDLLHQAAPAALLATLGCAVYFFWWRAAGRGGKRDPLKCRAQHPSPPKVLPDWIGSFGGHTLLLRKDKIVDQYEGWADEFGGTFELMVMGQRRVFISDPTEIHRMLSLRPAKFTRGFTEWFLWACRCTGMYPFLFADEGAVWGRTRRLVAPPLSGHNVQAMVPAMVKLAKTLLGKWAAAADEGRVVDAKDDLERFTHDAISLIGFQHDSKALEAKDDEVPLTLTTMRNMFNRINALVWDPTKWIAWSLGLPTPFVNDLKKEKRHMDVTIKDLMKHQRRILELERIDKSNASAENASQESVLGSGGSSEKASSSAANAAKASEGLLLRKLVESTDGRVGARGGTARMVIPENEIITNSRGLFIAGQETTGLLIAYSLYYMATRPHVLARCRDEVSRNVSSRDGMVKDYEEANSLVYIAAVFKEAARLKPSVPFLELWNKEDYTMLNGEFYPAGTGFVVMSRYTSTHEKYFTRAKEFIPERWIDAERKEYLCEAKTSLAENEAEPNVRHVEEAFGSFGSGPRVCPGMGMANLEAKVLLATLCTQFDFVLAPGQADPPEERFALTCGLKDLKILLKKRFTT